MTSMTTGGISVSKYIYRTHFSVVHETFYKYEELGSSNSLGLCCLPQEKL